MLLVPLGKKPPLADANCRRTVDDVMDLIHGAGKADCIGRMAATMALGDVRLAGSTSIVSTEPAVEGAALSPTVSVARSASTRFAAARYGYADAEPAAIARPVSEVRT